MNPAEFANIAKAERRFWWFQGMRRIFYRLVDPMVAKRRIDRVLEAGCGTGYFTLQLQRHYGWHMYPVDLGWSGLQYARRMGVPRPVQADIRSLPFPDAAFEAVVSADVLVHFPRGEEDEAMRELVRVLKPGGLLILRVAALSILRSRHSQFTGERQRFTRRRLVRLAKEHGLRVRRCTYANSLLLPLALLKFRVWEPLLRTPPTSGLCHTPGLLDRVLYLPLLLEAAWLSLGFNLPLGQSLILIGEKTRPA